MGNPHLCKKSKRRLTTGQLNAQARKLKAEILTLRAKAEASDEAKLDAAIKWVRAEIAAVREIHPPFNSAHEGYGVALEEVDELWDIVKTKQKNRNLNDMREEALQAAAMFIRFATEVCDEERGRR